MNKKELIIDSARTLFIRYGYKKVTMDEIAATANVTKKTVYAYFKDKDSLFKYFIDEELQVLKDKIETNKKKYHDVIDFFSNSVYEIINHQKNNPLIKNLFLESSEQEIKAKQFIKLYESEIISYLENLINEEIEKKTIRKCNSHLIAFTIYNIHLKVLFDYDGDIDAKKASDELANLLKSGLMYRKDDCDEN